MLGHFLKIYKKEAAPVWSADELKEQEPGTCVVALKAHEVLLAEGTSVEMQFGVWAGEGKLIVQKSLTEEWKYATFFVDYMEADGDWKYVRYESPYGDENKAETLKRAKERLHKLSKELRSYPGDDFVDECLTGKETLQLMERFHTRVGQHWWTPLQLPASYILEQFKHALARRVEKINLEEQQEKKEEKKASLWGRFKTAVASTSENMYNNSVRKLYESVSKIKEVPDSIKTPMLQHHGIMLEGEQVVHFSGSRIRTGSFRGFCETTPGTEVGGAATGEPQDAAEVRLVTRNRALMIYCVDAIKRGHWGDFNLLTNNAEHFCRACRSDKRESIQVFNAAINAVGTILALLPGMGWVSSLLMMVLRRKPKGGAHASLADLEHETP